MEFWTRSIKWLGSRTQNSAHNKAYKVCGRIFSTTRTEVYWCFGMYRVGRGCSIDRLKWPKPLDQLLKSRPLSAQFWSKLGDCWNESCRYHQDEQLCPPNRVSTAKGSWDSPFRPISNRQPLRRINTVKGLQKPSPCIKEPSQTAQKRPR